MLRLLMIACACLSFITCQQVVEKNPDSIQKTKTEDTLKVHLSLYEKDAQVATVFTKIDNEGMTEALEEMGSFFPGTPYQFGKELQRIGKLDMANDWFIAMAKHCPENERASYFFGKAWIHFNRGESQQAESDCKLILKVGSDPVTIARTHYLLGQIYTRGLTYDKARTSFLESEKIYTKQQKFGGVYLCIVGRAELLAREKEYEKAKTLIEQAKEIRSRSKNPPGLGIILELEADILFSQAQYKASAQQLELAKQEYTEKKQGYKVLWMDIKIGLAKCFQGEFLEAYEIAKSNHEIIAEMNYVEAAHYNNLTRILYRRCYDIDTKELDDPLLEWSHGPDSEPVKNNILTLHKFVHSVDCSSLN